MIFVVVVLIGGCCYLEHQRKEQNRRLAEEFKKEVVDADADKIEKGNDGRAIFVKG